MMRSLLVLLLISSGLAARAQDTGPKKPEVLTLKEAVAIARSNNRLVKNAQLAAQIDDDQIAEARTYRLPSLNVYALGSQLLTPVDGHAQPGGAFTGSPQLQGCR